MQYNCDHLFITEKLANRFISLKLFNHYEDTDIENLLFNIFKKILDNDYFPNERLLDNNDIFNIYLKFNDQINYKREKYFDIQKAKILNYYKKKQKKEEECFYTSEETIAKIKHKKSGALDQKSCIAICRIIIKNKIQSSFAEFFVLICRFIFSEIFDEKIKDSDYDFKKAFSNAQFLIFKPEIEETIKNYDKKINKEKQND